MIWYIFLKITTNRSEYHNSTTIHVCIGYERSAESAQICADDHKLCIMILQVCFHFEAFEWSKEKQLEDGTRRVEKLRNICILNIACTH